MPPARSRQLRLPTFIEPMLARPGKPFDSDNYLFEIKWDGTRALAFIDKDVRLLNRRRVEMGSRYPELADLRKLPKGTVLDGEIVVMRDGKPDFAALQAREHTRDLRRIASLARRTPASYVAFDLLYCRGQAILNEPLSSRRERLRGLLHCLKSPQITMSEGVEGRGVEFFAHAQQLGLEGVVAKRLAGRYLPGKRCDSWIKIKRQLILPCVVIGFLPQGSDDFESLLIAAQDGPDKPPRYVGRVGSGFDFQERARINRYLWSHRRDGPAVAAWEKRALWVEPGLYCTVRCMERTASGQLRAPTVTQLLVP